MLGACQAGLKVPPTSVFIFARKGLLLKMKDATISGNSSCLASTANGNEFFPGELSQAFDASQNAILQRAKEISAAREEVKWSVNFRLET